LDNAAKGGSCSALRSSSGPAWAERAG